MAKVHDIEDYLANRDVFVNGLDGRRAHMDSYMTVIDFINLDKAYKESEFKKEDWEEGVEYWKRHEYLSPTIGILRRTIERWISN